MNGRLQFRYLLLIVDLLFSTPQPEGHQLLSLALKITVIADVKSDVK